MAVEQVTLPLAECHSLSGADPTKDSEYAVLNSDDNDGLTINYKGGDICHDDTPYQLTINIKCDQNAESFTNLNVDDTDQCKRVITFSHKTGCKIGNLSALWDWFMSNKWVMFAVFVIVGAVVCFLGRTLFKPVLFIAGMFLSVSLVWLIFYTTFLSSTTKSWVGWVVLAGSLLLGTLIGAIFVKIAKLGAFVLAGWGGFSVALLIYNAFLYKIDSQVGFWCFCIGVALVFGILACFFLEHILIHSTALLGSFLVINGIGLVAGHYQNPFTIAEMIERGELETIDPIFYAYLASNIVLYLLGILFQYKQRKGDKVSGNDPYERLR